MTCTTPELPVLGCVVPGPAPTQGPPPPAPPVPVATHAAPVVALPPPPAPGVLVPDRAVPVLAPPLAPVPLAQVPLVVAPVIDLPRAEAAQTVAVTRVADAPPSALPGTVASSFAFVSTGVLGVALFLAFLSGLHRTTAGGTVNTHRTRLWTGLGVLGLAALVGGVGWYRLSGEPLLNRQIPFLASAGILVVLLSVLGGSLIIAEQLRGDQSRISDLEDAVRALTDALSPLVEQPPRGEAVSQNGHAPAVDARWS